jgi:hypothetical protein
MPSGIFCSQRPLRFPLQFSGTEFLLEFAAKAADREMKLPHFLSRRKLGRLSKHDERVFAEASELATLRLEQCIADLRLSVPTTNDAIPPRDQPARGNVSFTAFGSER